MSRKAAIQIHSIASGYHDSEADTLEIKFSVKSLARQFEIVIPVARGLVREEDLVAVAKNGLHIAFSALAELTKPFAITDEEMAEFEKRGPAPKSKATPKK